MRLLLAAGLAARGLACTNLLIPAGSSQDGSTMIAYSADDASMFGDLSHWPAGDHAEGALRDVYSWDYGNRLGAIPQPAHTYNVVGNTNEHQLTIGESTFGGLEMLDGSGQKPKAVCNATYGCLDYAQIIWVTLQRARTAREAIKVMDDLMQTYGYASSGESYSIADPHEVWQMEVIGKGSLSKGTVWAAVRIPDGHVSAHANQARIRQVPWHDPDAAMASPDVVDFARGLGLYNGTDEDFSFSDTYDPVTWSGARFCEARVYSFFASVAAESERMADYIDYVTGQNLSHRMPLYVKVAAKLTLNDTFWHMRNHYEGTPMDQRHDVGAQQQVLPTRMGESMMWKSGGKSYFSERPIGTWVAGWNMVGVQRASSNYSVLWFGVDDSTFSLHAPFYGATRRVPAAWDGGNCTGITSCRQRLGLTGSMVDFSFQSMHWVGNMIANFAYSQYKDVAPAVQERLVQLEGQLMQQVAQMDRKLAGMTDANASAEEATDFSYRTAEGLHREWLDFYGKVFMTYVDGYKMVPDPENEFSGCDKQTPHWTPSWRDTIANLTGDRYEVPDPKRPSVDKDGRPDNGVNSDGHPMQLLSVLEERPAQAGALASVDKMSLRALGGRRAPAAPVAGRRLRGAVLA